MIRKSTLLVMTAAVAACIAGCSKEDIEAAREAGTNAVSKVADKTIELSDGPRASSTARRSTSTSAS